MIKSPIDMDLKLISKLTAARALKMKSYIAILLVSVGNENFEGEAIAAAVKMINQEFKACCIVIADTLQRHNIATEKEINEEDAYKESLVKGDEWLKRNEIYFQNILKIPYEIIRWDCLINDMDFLKKEKLFSAYIKENKSFLNAMNHSIDEYGMRLIKHLGDEHFNRIGAQHKSSCFAYLKEECIAISIIPKKIYFNKNESAPLVIVYPGKSTLILTANRDVFIANEFHEMIQKNSDYLSWLPYRFKRIKKQDNDIQSTPSLRPINNLADKNSEKLFLKQVDYINKLSEIQLSSITNLLDEKEIIEFKKYLLGFFMDKDLFISVEKNLYGHNKLLSIKSLSYIFAVQLISMFQVLEEKFANKCKANIVRILKRDALAFISEEENGLAIMD